MGDAEIARLTRAREEARREADLSFKNMEEELERIRSEYEMELRSRDTFYKTEASRETQKLDNIIRENERLRQFVGEHRHQAETIDNVGATIQTHISRMEQQTQEMRNELGRFFFGSKA